MLCREKLQPLLLEWPYSLVVVANIVFVSEKYEAVGMGSHHVAVGDMAGGTWVGGRAAPGEGAHEHVADETAPCTCYWRGVDPVDGHVSADVKNFGALQELLVLNGLFPRHPDHGLLKVGGCDFFPLEEERDFTPVWRDTLSPPLAASPPLANPEALLPSQKAAELHLPWLVVLAGCTCSTPLVLK